MIGQVVRASLTLAVLNGVDLEHIL